ncbi:MAG: hypothetical protein ACREKB_05210 [Candidatus Rokuibacteriota bacterium]
MSPARRRPGLVAVWLLLAVLVGAIVVIEYTDRRRERSGGAGETDARMLVSVPVDHLGAIEVAVSGRLHRFERDPSGTWFYHGIHTGATTAHTHTADPVLAERIERTMAAFGRTRIERDFAVGGEGAVYGVTTPEILFLLYRPNQSQPLAQYAVGNVAPDTVSQYVMLVGSPAVVTIPKYQIDNVLALIHAAGERSDQGTAGRR